MWELGCEESWVPKNWCFWTVVLEKTLESPLDFKEIQPVHPKGDQSWVFIGRTDAEAETNTLATSCEELTHWKRPGCWEGFGAGGEGGDRGWDDWMVSPTWWTWVWVNSGNWQWTGRPGVLRFMGSQRVGHDWATELNRTELNPLQNCCLKNPLDRGAWQATVHSVAKSQTWLSDWAQQIKKGWISFTASSFGGPASYVCNMSVCKRSLHIALICIFPITI